MKCTEELANKVCDYLGGDLDSEPCKMIREHMEKCHNCEVYIDKVKKTVEIYKRVEDCDDMPDSVCKKLFFTLDLKMPNPDSKK